MNDRDVQMTMAAAGYYEGGIDGIIGPKSTQAIARIVQARSHAHGLVVQQRIVGLAGRV